MNGHAAIVDDPEVLQPCAAEGKVPELGLRISIDEAYTHCPKAFLRAQLWDPERYVSRDELPSAGRLMRSVGAEVDPDTHDAERAERYSRRKGFY